MEPYSNGSSTTARNKKQNQVQRKPEAKKEKQQHNWKKDNEAKVLDSKG